MTSIDNPVHSLTFGSITLADNGAWPPDANGVQYVVRPTDTSWGSPSPVTVAVLSLLRQGSLVAYDHTENRDITLRVTVIADDGDRLALGERALQLECEKTNTLTWTPPDGAGQPSVFDIVWSQMELDFDHQDELLVQRTYKITMQALPYARTASLVVTPAVGSAVETVVDNGSATTGWAGGLGVITTAGGAVVDTYNASAAPFEALLRTGSVSLAGKTLLEIRWASSVPLYGIAVSLNGGSNLVEVSRFPAGSYSSSYFRLPSGLTSASTIRITITPSGATGSQTFSVDNISLWTALPFFGTARQTALSIIPGGSVRTQGSIQVSASNALGKTIVYTHPSGTGYLPPLRPWLKSSASVTTDTTLVSGARNAIGATTTIYELPVANLPQGRAEVWAILRDTTTTGARTVDWAIASYMGSTLVDYDLRGTTVTIAATNTWYLVALGAAIMPPSQLGTAGKVQVHLHTASSTCEVDEAYLFATDQGRLTIVDCGTTSPAAGGSSNRLWIEAPTADLPMGGVYRGFAADGSDRFHAGLSATVWEIHDFDPTGMNLFVVTPNATDSTASLTHYRRYQTHVVDEG